MSWQALSVIQVTETWQFSAPTQGSLFRLKHSLFGTAHSFVIGWVCQAHFIGDKVEIYQPKKTFPVDEFVVFEFVQPICFFDRIIGLKKSRTREKNNLVWTVEIDNWT